MLVTIRKIRKDDNKRLAEIIRSSLEEYNLAIEGTVYTDPTTDALFELFQQPGSFYYVAEKGDVLLGGCGVFPTPGLPAGYAELVKLYLLPDARGKGTAKILMDHCMEAAGHLGYTHLYLESFPELHKAISLYRQAGFTSLTHPLGNSGHHACNVWMVKDLKALQ